MSLSVQAKTTETSFSYDSNSNRISETVSIDGAQEKSLTYSYDSNNRLTEITDNLDSSQNISYTYDNNGNRTSKTQATETSNYIYDVHGCTSAANAGCVGAANAKDQLVRVEENSNTMASFAYDHQGMRIKKEGERGTEIYTYDDQSVLCQSDSNGALQAKYTYGPNQLLSMSEPAGQAQYYLFDGLGSPITLTKASGEVAARYSYDAFGNKIQNTGDSANRFTFTGHEEDKETDLIYMKARYYDPDTGQFLTEDNFGGFPDQPPSLNKYLYAYNNPGIYVDPDGNIAFVPMAIGAAVNVGLDLAIQGAEYALGERTELDTRSLSISAGSGAAGVGLVNNVNKLAKLGKLANSSKVLSKAAKNTKVQNAARGAAAFGVDASVTAADMAARGEEVTTGDVVKSTLFGMAIGKQIDKVIGGVGKNKGMRVQESKSNVGSEKDVFKKWSNNFGERKHRDLNLSINERGLVEAERKIARQSNWIRPDGSTWYPPYDGAIPGTQKYIDLEPGKNGSKHLVDRVGLPFGKYVSPEGTPLEARALSPKSRSQDPRTYSVDQVIPGVEKSLITPWFDEKGLGVQYRLPRIVDQHVRDLELGDLNE